jgi:outer membrane protein OmpA-like peptidoglycan-associated protein
MKITFNYLTIICILLFITQKTTAQIQRNIPETYKIKLKVVDRESFESLEGAYVKIKNLTTNSFDSTIVENGIATFNLKKGNIYDINTKKKRYIGRKGNFDASCYLKDPAKIFCVSGMEIDAIDNADPNNHIIDATIKMTPLKIGSSFKIENIRYDLNKWFIRPEAAKELDKLVEILVENSDISVELGSHTDCRSSNDYNQKLSQKRAQSAVDYIVSKGISKKRIVAKGYGETVLLNKCADGVTCNEEEHQANRRTEVKITGVSADGSAVDMKGNN